MNASFNRPIGVALNELNGDIYVSENNGHIIRKVSSEGVYSFIHTNNK